MKTRFLLCIGCQKGGTTWLSEHLRKMPEVRLGVRKEMHVLDAHFLDSMRNAHTAKIGRREAQLARLASADGDNADLTRRLHKQISEYREAQALVSDLDAYASYYRKKADADRGVTVVADITPTYAFLEAEHWVVVRKTLEENDFDIRILFLMRDPVERLESAWRMVARNSTRIAAHGKGRVVGALLKGAAYARHVAAKVLPVLPDGRFLRFALDDLRLDRSRYERTMQAVEAVFPTSQIHYEFFETLFNDGAITKITDFVGLPARPGDFGKRVNSSPLRTPIPAKDFARVRKVLDPTYRRCAERFGEAEIKAIWKYY